MYEEQVSSGLDEGQVSNDFRGGNWTQVCSEEVCL